MMTDRNIEMMAQKIAQQQDSGIYSATYDFEASPKETFLDDIANNTPNSGMFDVVKKKSKKLKHQVINLNNYERYWDNSTPNGHQIRILNKDDSTLTINCNWPKGTNPRLHDIDEERYGGTKRKSQRLKKKSKTTRRGKK